MKRTLADLNDYMFDELDRLSNEDLTGDALMTEIGRANAMTRVAERAPWDARGLDAMKEDAKKGWNRAMGRKN